MTAIILMAGMVIGIMMGLVGGSIMTHRRAIDYKQRWLEANKLLQDRWDDHDTSSPPTIAPDDSNLSWQVEMVYHTTCSGLKAEWYAVKGMQRLLLVWLQDPVPYPHLRKSYGQEAQATVRDMNKNKVQVG